MHSAGLVARRGWLIDNLYDTSLFFYTEGPDLVSHYTPSALGQYIFSPFLAFPPSPAPRESPTLNPPTQPPPLRLIPRHILLVSLLTPTPLTPIPLTPGISSTTTRSSPHHPFHQPPNIPLKPRDRPPDSRTPHPADPFKLPQHVGADAAHEGAAPLGVGGWWLVCSSHN